MIKSSDDAKVSVVPQRPKSLLSECIIFKSDSNRPENRANSLRLRKKAWPRIMEVKPFLYYQGVGYSK